jgi:hypothetical protein
VSWNRRWSSLRPGVHAAMLSTRKTVAIRTVVWIQAASQRRGRRRTGILPDGGVAWRRHRPLSSDDPGGTLAQPSNQ